MTLRRVTYISRVDPAVASTDLRQILGLAEVLHRRRDLSGLLAYTGSHFFQVIEGADLDVESLLNLIRADNRHSQMRLLCDERVVRRIFDRWFEVFIDSMALTDKIETAHASGGGNCSLAEELIEQLLSAR